MRTILHNLTKKKLNKRQQQKNVLKLDAVIRNRIALILNIDAHYGCDDSFDLPKITAINPWLKWTVNIGMILSEFFMFSTKKKKNQKLQNEMKRFQRNSHWPHNNLLVVCIKLLISFQWYIIIAWMNWSKSKLIMIFLQFNNYVNWSRSDRIILHICHRIVWHRIVHWCILTQTYWNWYELML